jgi:hypothetical protein
MTDVQLIAALDDSSLPRFLILDILRRLPVTVLQADIADAFG